MHADQSQRAARLEVGFFHDPALSRHPPKNASSRESFQVDNLSGLNPACPMNQKPFPGSGISAMILAAAISSPALSEQVRVEKTPNGGIQPQAVMDSNGRLHLIYFNGDPMRGDIYYVTREEGSPYSRPIRVNSQARSAIATGSVRGAHLAVDGDGRPHVAWMGSDEAQPRPRIGAPMLYTRLDDARSAFEAQRNLVTWATGLDGGGSVAADNQGNVFVVWHAGPDGHDAGEEARGVFVARSANKGRNFTKETRADKEAGGACGCCGMRAFSDGPGKLNLLYRSASNSNRDMKLLMSNDSGATFETSTLNHWRVAKCPMSTSGMSKSPDLLLLASEIGGGIQLRGVSRSRSKDLPQSPVHTVRGRNGKHPVVARNQRGETLLAWIEGSGWNRGGALAWTLLDKDWHASPSQTIENSVPVWSLLSAVSLPDGAFILFH